MTEKPHSLRERLERVWAKRRPDRKTGQEVSAEGVEVRTPERDEFFGNLEKAAEELPHPRADKNGGA